MDGTEFKAKEVEVAMRWCYERIKVINNMTADMIDFMQTNMADEYGVSVDAASWNWRVARAYFPDAVKWLFDNDFRRQDGSNLNVLPVEDSYAEYWCHDEYSRIYLTCLGKECRTIQVGTEMRAVPVYKTVCDGDEPGSPTPEPILDETALAEKWGDVMS